MCVRQHGLVPMVLYSAFNVAIVVLCLCSVAKAPSPASPPPTTATRRTAPRTFTHRQASRSPRRHPRRRRSFRVTRTCSATIVTASLALAPTSSSIYGVLTFHPHVCPNVLLPPGCAEYSFCMPFLVCNQYLPFELRSTSLSSCASGSSFVILSSIIPECFACACILMHSWSETSKLKCTFAGWSGHLSWH